MLISVVIIVSLTIGLMAGYFGGWLMNKPPERFLYVCLEEDCNFEMQHENLIKLNRVRGNHELWHEVTRRV